MVQLNKSMTCQHLKLGYSGHYPIDPYTTPWSPKGLGHGEEWPTPIWSPLYNVNLLSHSWDTAIKKMTMKILGQCHMCGQGSRSHLTLKIQGQSHGQDQTHWSPLRPRVQSICSLFILWQSEHFCVRYSKFYIWPWKFNIKVMARVKVDGKIWGLDFNQYVCFCFLGIGPFLDEIYRSTYLTLKIEE